MISLILSLILTSSANAQSINASVVRLSPTAVPTVCSTGDLRIDSGDSNSLKVCRSNTWYEFAEVLTSFSDPMTTNGDMIYRAAGVPARLGIGTTNYALVSTGSAPSWALITNANVDASAALAYSKLSLTDSILNADINSSAGIVDTKLATISTIGKVSNSATTATSTNTASAIVARDGSGNFTAGTITASLSGNVTGNLTGNVTGNASTATALAANPSDCSANNYATTIAANGNLTCAQVSLSAGVTGTLPIANGGTGQTTAQAAIDALLPSQSGNSGKVLRTDGTTASWETSSGGSGGLNFFGNPDAEAVVTGCAAYADAAGSAPVDGTGGSPSVTVTRNTTDPLRGDADFYMAKGASNLQGQGVACDLTLEYADETNRSRAIYVSFDYWLQGGGATGDVRAYIIPSGGTAVPLDTDTGTDLDGKLTFTENHAGRVTGFFTSTANVSAYKLVFHVTNTGTSTADLWFDNLRATPDATVPGYIGTEWTAYTPTTQGLGTLSSVNLEYRRNGDTLEIQGHFTTGTVAASEIRIGLPTSAVTDSTISGRRTVGRWTRDTSSTTAWKGGTLLADGGQTYLTASVDDYTNGTSPLNSQNGSALWASSQKISIYAAVKIQDWDASASLSTSEMLTRGAYASYYGDPASAASGAPIIVPTKSVDKLSSYNATTGIFTAPATGAYSVSGYISSGSAAMSIWPYINSVRDSNNILGQTDSNGETMLSGTVHLTAGQTFYIGQIAGTVNADYAVLNIRADFDPTVFSVYGQTALYPASGYSSGGLVNYSFTANQFGDLDSETLQPGEYDLDGQATWYSNGAVTTTAIAIGLSTVSGNDGTGLVVGQNFMQDTKNASSGMYNVTNLSIKGIVVTSPTTYYFKSYAATSVTNLQIGWSWRFRKVK